jgi:hypothetical protein
MFRERYESGIGEELSKLEKALSEDGIDILDIWIKGQPPRIDEMAGTARVSREQLGAAIGRILALQNVNLDVWIKGQPPRLEMVDVDFRTPGLR